MYRSSPFNRDAVHASLKSRADVVKQAVKSYNIYASNNSVSDGRRAIPGHFQHQGNQGPDEDTDGQDRERVVKHLQVFIGNCDVAGEEVYSTAAAAGV